MDQIRVQGQYHLLKLQTKCLGHNSKLKCKCRTDDSKLLCALEVAELFHSELNKSVKRYSSTSTRYKIELYSHGDVATQMYIYKSGKLSFKADLVPCIEIGNDMFVVQPNTPNCSHWRKSHSRQERVHILNMDNHDRGCRRQIMRILKALCADKFPELSSYHFKTALLIATRSHATSRWQTDTMLVRLMCVLKTLESCFRSGNLPNFFDSDTNVIAGMNCADANSFASRLSTFQQDVDVFRKVMISKNKPVHPEKVKRLPKARIHQCSSKAGNFEMQVYPENGNAKWQRSGMESSELSMDAFTAVGIPETETLLSETEGDEVSLAKRLDTYTSESDCCCPSDSDCPSHKIVIIVVLILAFLGLIAVILWRVFHKTG